MYGLLNSRSTARIFLSETPTVLKVEAFSLVVKAKECREKLRSFQFQKARRSSADSKQAN